MRRSTSCRSTVGNLSARAEPALLAVVVAVIGGLLAAGRGGAQADAFPHGVAAGDVTDAAAVVWTRTADAADVRVIYSLEPGFTGAQFVGPTRTDRAADYTLKAALSDLRPGQRYYYRAATPSVVGPSGSFVTAPARTADAPLVVVWGADTYENNMPFRIFQAMRARNADLFLFLGDTIYSDLGAVRAATLDEYRAKYRLHRDDPHLRGYLASTSTWVVWDDHEVENNFSGNHPRMSVGRQALLEYWPIRPHADDPRRLYRRVRWGRTAEIFILDTRQYRSPAAQPDGPAKTMLGAAQKQWLLDGLAQSEAAVKIVATSVILRYASGDSWAGYARERDEILGFVRDRRIANVVVLSADVHYAAAIRHAEGVFEGIAGPLAAFTGTARAAGRPGTLWAQAGKLNYGALAIQGETITMSWWDDQNAPLFETRLPIAR
jgi:alkaline phosphatase D